MHSRIFPAQVSVDTISLWIDAINMVDHGRKKEARPPYKLQKNLEYGYHSGM